MANWSEVSSWKSVNWLKVILVALFVVGFAGFVQPGITNAAGTTTLTIVNDGDQEIYWVYPRPSDTAQWCKDLLGADTIQPGATWRTRITVGTYDLAAEDPTGAVIGQLDGIAIQQPYTWHVGQQDAKVSVSERNEQAEALCELYLSPSTDSEWGENRLGSTPLDRGATWRGMIAPGQYDFKAVGCSGEVLDQAFGLDLGHDSAWVTP